MNKLNFIDIHSHGAYGINFNTGDYFEIKSLLKKLFKRNIKGICPTLVGDSNKNIQKQLSIFNKIKEEQLKNKEKECLILGVHLEGTFLSPEKSGIQDKKVFKKPTIKNFQNLVGEFEKIIKIVTIAPELDADLINYLNSKKIITQAGHSNGEDIKNCKGITHIFNAMPQIHHRNNSITLEGLTNDKIYCEIIADLIHTSKNTLKLLLKTKPLEKILLISDSLPSSHFEEKIIFCNKEIINGKDENGTLAGSNNTIDEICKNLIKEKIMTKDEILVCAFENQIKYLNLKNREIDILKQ